jgi:hypothetical protein
MKKKINLNTLKGYRFFMCTTNEARMTSIQTDVLQKKKHAGIVLTFWKEWILIEQSLVDSLPFIMLSQITGPSKSKC